MLQQQLCQGCNQRHKCHRLYEQLGKAKGPPVVCKVLVAFALPIVVFIAALTAFAEILSETINTAQTRTALSCLAALAVTLSVIMLTKTITAKLNKTKQKHN